MASAIDRGWQLAFWIAYRAARVWWFVRRPTVRSAFVAVWWDDRLLLIRNSYKPGETIPSGGLRRGETARAGAVRELAEEVGLRVEEHALEAVFETVIRHAHTRDHVAFFELHCEARPAIRVDRREVVAGEFCPRSELGSRSLVPHVQAYLSARDDEARPR